jgi:hypothetical protein
MEWDEDLNSANPAPRGYIDSKHNKQGGADNQLLKMQLSHLKVETDYQLLALRGDEINYTKVLDLTTDSSGSVKLQYKSVGSSRGRGKGHAKFALPAALNPISDIRSLVLADVNTQAVLHVNLGAPANLHYLIKRNLENDGPDLDAMASLSLKANVRQSKFDLHAAGLDPQETYFLSLNGEIHEELTSNDDGTLALSTWMVHPQDVLDVRTIAVWDKGSNSVLSTTLVSDPR